MDNLLRYLVCAEEVPSGILYAERLPWYRSSYLERSVQALQRCVFEKCERLFGGDFLRLSLSLFLKGQVSHPLYLHECAFGFGDFLWSHAGDDHARAFAATALLCERWWFLLHGPDARPFPEPPGIYLKQTCEVIEHRADMLALWNEKPQNEWAIHGSLQKHLLVKTSAITMELFFVPPSCWLLLEHLLVPKPLDEFVFQDLNSDDTQVLVTFVELLSQGAAFHQKNS